MIRKTALLLVVMGLTTAMGHSASNSILFENSKAQHIIVNNRILANVHGKSISVIDLMKKMDLLFYRRFPQYASSVEARFQFYQINWRYVLKELIEKELILADAEESKVPISNGDVRQEMENLFGPNIISNLDKAGLTFEEAWEMVKEEIIMRKMVGFRINSKAIRAVTPQDVTLAYEEFSKKNKPADQWRYRVVSIRGAESTDSAETANAISELVTLSQIPIEQLQPKIKELALAKNSATVNLSTEYTHSEKEVSDLYKEILSSLTPGSYSKPISQKSKADQILVFRIFYLIEPIEGKVAPFSEMEKQLKNQLLDKAVEQEAEHYMTKLKSHFNVNDTDLDRLVPDHFQPFSLK